MDELFRFHVLRSSGPPTAVTAVGAPPSAAEDSGLQQSLVAAKEGAAPRSNMENLALQHTQSATFPETIADYRYGKQLQFLLASASEAKDLGQWLKENPVDLKTDEEGGSTLEDDRVKAADALVALTITAKGQDQAKHSVALAAASTILRGAALIDVLKKKQSASPAGADLAKWLATPIALPASIFPLPSAFGDTAPARKEKATAEAAKAEEFRKDGTKRRKEAIAQLRSIERASENLRTALTRKPAQVAARIEAPEARPAARRDSNGGLFQALRRRISGVPAGVTEAPTVRLVVKPFTPQSLGLDDPTTHTLSGLGLGGGFTGDQAFNVLEEHGTRLRLEIRGRAERPSGEFRKFLPYNVPAGDPVPPPGADDEPPPPNLSSQHGAIEKLTTADLMIVHQVLERYEAGEIAHIENVLVGETRRYQTKRTRTVEEFSETETETTTEEERDQQTTDRFELKRESEKTIQQDSELKAGLALSARYGSVLEVNTNVSGSLSEHKEESTKQSVTFSKDVTSRATSKITEQVRKLQSRRTTEKYIEANLHEFKGAETKANICGIYQWINKVYQAQVLNYGQRAMYNIVVPEPAAFWLDAYQQRDAAVAIKPLPFELSPAQISSRPGDYLRDENQDPIDLNGNPLPDGATPIPSDYLFYAARYQATGVKPAPAIEIMVSKTASAKVQGGGGDSSGDSSTKELSIPIPGGYVAVSAFLTGSWKSDSEDHWNNGEHNVMVLVGPNALGFSHPAVDWQGPEMDLRKSPLVTGSEGLGVTGEVGVAINTWNIVDYALTINVVCRATPEALWQWQLDTYGAIMQGYLKMQADYDEKRTEAQNQAFSMRTFGTNPDMNKKLITEEVKKSCISVISKQHFGWIGAIENALPDGPHVYPQPDLDKLDARASYIQFIEQAFEWEHMTYFFYPYFWGRKSGWYDKAYLDNADPAFYDFLKAGAARCVVPVRPGFEEAVAHFIDTQYLWNENNNGALSPELMAIVDEIKASADANGLPPTPVGKPWDVRVPTTLIRLREDDSLPVWIPDPAATSPTEAWVPAKWDKTQNKYVPDPEQ